MDGTKDLTCELLGRGFGETGDHPEIGKGGLEHRHHSTAAIVASLEDRSRQGHEAPHEVECIGSIGFGDLIDDGAALGLKISDKRLSLLPVDIGLRTADGGKAFADFPPDRRRIPSAGQFEPKAPLGRGISLTDLYQQGRQTLGAKRL